MSRHINNKLRTSQSHLLAVLKDRGYRATAPRKAIANLLEQKHDGFTIEALSKELPSVGRATLFRTIKLFLEAGVLCRLIMMDGAKVYSLAQVDHHHYHSVCVECGLVEEFSIAAVERMLRDISTEVCCKVVDHLLELYVNCGLCPADKESNQPYSI